MLTKAQIQARRNARLCITNAPESSSLYVSRFTFRDNVAIERNVDGVATMVDLTPCDVAHANTTGSASYLFTSKQVDKIKASLNKEGYASYFLELVDETTEYKKGKEVFKHKGEGENINLSTIRPSTNAEMEASASILMMD